MNFFINCFFKKIFFQFKIFIRISKKIFFKFRNFYFVVQNFDFFRIWKFLFQNSEKFFLELRFFLLDLFFRIWKFLFRNAEKFFLEFRNFFWIFFRISILNPILAVKLNSHIVSTLLIC